ncbi:ABC transporter permease [Aquamicrobium sp. NLF2-7]|uniref:ABC transporter permease n=1 Tax=Aquamicrobium TaxID=69278 RepID=UPI001EFAEFB9|nr:MULTISPECIES: ABC transporter permease [Aquamicrobium]MCG8274646.1 ABC transporter permease [Aquamicrobium sp. NLF2-7]MCK9549391.1 ABC transporter permease [Aquamicrobium sp.]MDH4989582.1 ABC transporter permease [Aquamicrobium lusatiense]
MNMGRTLWDYAFLGIVTLIYIFLMSPILLVVLMSLSGGEFLAFPPQGISLRWFGELFSNARFLSAALHSVQLAAVSAVVNGVIGTLAAIYVVRFAPQKLANGLRLLMSAPLLVPEILTAIALLFFFFEFGVGNDYPIAIQTGHIVVTFPYVFLNVASALFNFDRSQEEAARSLGAGNWMTFRRVTLPAIKPGVITGCLFAFVISFDIFNISLLLKPVGMTTLPLELFDYLRFNFDPTAAAVATLSIVVTFVAVLIVDLTVGLRSLRF